MAHRKISPNRTAVSADTAPMLTIGRIAEQLDVSERTVRRWIDDNKLVAHRIGRTIRIAPSDLGAFLARCR
jgi:excisionase family DNA binding protein